MFLPKGRMAMDERAAYCRSCDDLFGGELIGIWCPNECGLKLLPAVVSECDGGDGCEADVHHFGLGVHLVPEYN